MIKPKKTAGIRSQEIQESLTLYSLHTFFLPADAKSAFALKSKEGRGWLAKGEVRMSTDLCPCSEV